MKVKMIVAFEVGMKVELKVDFEAEMVEAVRWAADVVGGKHVQ